MQIELTDKEYEMLKILLNNTNECSGGCYIEEYQYEKFDCIDCDFFNRKNDLIEKVMNYSKYEDTWNRNTIDLEEFVKGNIAVHCDTEEKALDFFSFLKEHDILWETGKELTDDTLFSIYEDKMTYNFESIGILYANVGYYKTLRYKVVKWEVE